VRADAQLQVGRNGKVEISEVTKAAVHELVREAVIRLSHGVADLEILFDEPRLERGPDGHFRPRQERIRSLRQKLSDDFLASLPEYQKCTEQLKADEVIGPHLDNMIGTSASLRRLDVNDVLHFLVHSMLDEQGITFTDQNFQLAWAELAAFFTEQTLKFKTVAPLPRLAISTLPLELNAHVVLDRFTNEEMTRCYRVGVIRPASLGYPIIDANIAMGIRQTTSLPKVILQDEQSHEELPAEGEGTFGRRPFLRPDLIVDDVLSTLRLLKHSQIRSAGWASWSDSLWLKGATSYRVLGQWPYGGGCEITNDDIPQFLHLWQLLEEGTNRFGFIIHRFNIAFDRGLLVDRIVDLVIAAEALLLGDLDDRYRGELRYRFALRAAKFIKHPTYTQHEVFQIMRGAYDARSSIVHGGSPKQLRLPNNSSPNLPSFSDAVEELVRLGLHKALSMKADAVKLRNSEFWDQLVFPQ
jgi:hypothetical protein